MIGSIEQQCNDIVFVLLLFFYAQIQHDCLMTVASGFTFQSLYIVDPNDTSHFHPFDHSMFSSKETISSTRCFFNPQFCLSHLQIVPSSQTAIKILKKKVLEICHAFKHHKIPTYFNKRNTFFLASSCVVSTEFMVLCS